MRRVIVLLMLSSCGVSSVFVGRLRQSCCRRSLDALQTPRCHCESCSRVVAILYTIVLKNILALAILSATWRFMHNQKRRIYLFFIMSRW